MSDWAVGETVTKFGRRYTCLKAWNHFSGHGVANKIVVVGPMGLAVVIILGVLFLLRHREGRFYIAPENHSLRQKR